MASLSVKTIFMKCSVTSFTWAGRKVWERHKGKFEPVVNEDLFAQVQRVLKNKGHKVAQYKTDHPDFPLRRFVLNPMV